MKSDQINYLPYLGALKNSPAEKSGLQIGDKIVSVNGIEIRTIFDFANAIKNNREKRIVEVLRGNQFLTIEFELFDYEMDKIEASELKNEIILK